MTGDISAVYRDIKSETVALPNHPSPANAFDCTIDPSITPQRNKSMPDSQRAWTKTPIPRLQRPHQPSKPMKASRARNAYRPPDAESVTQTQQVLNSRQNSAHQFQVTRLTRARQLSINRWLSLASGSTLPAATLNYSIRLPRGGHARVKTLCDIRSNILHDERELLDERLCYLNSDLLPLHEFPSHVTVEGDACASLFATVPVEVKTSVKQVFEALRKVLMSDKGFTCNHKSTSSGTDADDADPVTDKRRIAQQEYVRTSWNGATVESKWIVFSEYQGRADEVQVEHQPCSEQATIVIQSIKDDEFHPNTSGCMRLGVTSVINIHHSREHAEKYGLGSCHNNDTKDGIAITRVSFVKLRRCGVAASRSELQAEMEFTMSKGSNALTTVMDLLTRN